MGRSFLRNHAPNIEAMDFSLSRPLAQNALWLRRFVSSSQRYRLIKVYNKSNGGVGCTSDTKLSLRRGATLSAIVIESLALSSYADCAQWAFGTSPLQARLGGMALPND
jgi:hypothetical protein